MSPLPGLKKSLQLPLFPRLSPWAIPLCGTAQVGFRVRLAARLTLMGASPPRKRGGASSGGFLPSSRLAGREDGNEVDSSAGQGGGTQEL